MLRGAAEVLAGITNRLDVEIADNGGVVEAVIRSAPDEDSVSPMAILVPEDDPEAQSVSVRRMELREGVLRSSGVAPGRYRLILIEQSKYFQSSRWLSKEKWSTAKRIPVNAGETVKLDVEWEP